MFFVEYIAAPPTIGLATATLAERPSAMTAPSFKLCMILLPLSWRSFRAAAHPATEAQSVRMPPPVHPCSERARIYGPSGSIHAAAHPEAEPYFMLIILLAYLGGILTIVSPCILPVLPFVFARAGRSFARSTLPMLAGMAATFAIVATLAAVGGGWAVRANQVGRWAALVLLALFGIALVFPAISDRMTRPLVALGSRLSERQPGERESIWSSAVLGVATGLLWAPCA